MVSVGRSVAMELQFNNSVCVCVCISLSLRGSVLFALLEAQYMHEWGFAFSVLYAMVSVGRSVAMEPQFNNSVCVCVCLSLSLRGSMLFALLEAQYTHAWGFSFSVFYAMVSVGRSVAMEPQFNNCVCVCVCVSLSLRGSVLFALLEAQYMHEWGFAFSVFYAMVSVGRSVAMEPQFNNCVCVCVSLSLAEGQYVVCTT